MTTCRTAENEQWPLPWLPLMQHCYAGQASEGAEGQRVLIWHTVGAIGERLALSTAHISEQNLSTTLSQVFPTRYKLTTHCWQSSCMTLTQVLLFTLVVCVCVCGPWHCGCSSSSRTSRSSS